MIRKGQICIWNKRRADGTVSRIMCCVVNRTSKNVEIVRWTKRARMYVNAWATPESLVPATPREIREFEKQAEERRGRMRMASA